MKTFFQWLEATYNPLDNVTAILTKISDEFPRANKDYWPFYKMLRELGNAREVSGYDLPAVDDLLQNPNNYLPVLGSPEASAANRNRLNQVIQSISHAQPETSGAFGGDED